MVKVNPFVFLLVSYSLIGVYGAPKSSPTIISRAQWGARLPKSSSYMATPVPNAVIHHSDGPSCSSQSACIRTVKGIQNYHMDSNKWDDIGYHFLVGGDGQVYEGRGWNKVGAHSPGYNDKSIGICLLGTFTSSLPPQAQLNAVKDLIDYGVQNKYITGNYKLYGHRDVRSTACPGDRLYNEISTWPHKAPAVVKKKNCTISCFIFPSILSINFLFEFIFVLWENMKIKMPKNCNHLI